MIDQEEIDRVMKLLYAANASGGVSQLNAIEIQKILYRLRDAPSLDELTEDIGTLCLMEKSLPKAIDNKDLRALLSAYKNLLYGGIKEIYADLLNYATQTEEIERIRVRGGSNILKVISLGEDLIYGLSVERFIGFLKDYQDVSTFRMDCPLLKSGDAVVVVDQLTNQFLGTGTSTNQGIKLRGRYPGPSQAQGIGSTYAGEKEAKTQG